MIDLKPSNLKDIENHLKSVDVMELTNRIKKFRSLNFKTISDIDLRNEISNVLTWNGRFCYCANLRYYPSQLPLFRVRKLSGSKIPIDNFKNLNDMWEPPTSVLTKYGRLNKPKESLLYVAQDLVTAIKESRIQPGELYAAIQYIPKENIKLSFIGGDYNYSELGISDNHAILVHEIYNNFLRDEFSRDVGQGTEYLYRISEMIAKDYFDFPPRVIQDAWAYSSIQDKSRFNVCFRPEIAHEILEVQGAMICEKDITDNIVVKYIAVYDEKMKYYHIGSPVQKKLFPHIHY